MMQKRRISHDQFRNTVVALMFLSLIPIVYAFTRSSEFLKKYEIKSIAKKRRERLDQEHGIDRESYTEDMKTLDYVYRVTEKEEIKKMRELGKNPIEIIEHQNKLEEDEDVDKIIKEQLLQGDDKVVQIKQGKNFERIEVSNSLEEVPDPRIHGAKVIFDSRLDETLSHYNESKAKSHNKETEMKEAKEDSLEYPDYPMITSEDKKQALLEAISHKEEIPSFRKKRQAESDDGTEINKEEKLRQIHQAFINFKKLMIKKGVPTNYINYIFEKFKERLVNNKMNEEEINQFFMYLATHIPKVKFVNKLHKTEKKSKPIEEYTLDYLCESVKSKDALNLAKSELNSEFKDFKDCIIKTIEKEFAFLQSRIDNTKTKNYESVILTQTLNKINNEYISLSNMKDLGFDERNYRNRYSNLLQKVSILEEYLKNNVVGEQNPILRCKMIENRNKLLEEYNCNVFEENYEKVNSVDKIAKRIIRNNDDSSKMFEKELKKYMIMKELEGNKSQITGENPLELPQIIDSLKDLESHAHFMKLPDTLVSNAKHSIVNMISSGIPSEDDVENSTRLLCESLKNLVSLLEFERFHDITLEELQSRISTQKIINYFLSFKSYIYSDVVVPNNVITPDDKNFQNFKNIGEAYKNMSKEEKEKLHEFDTIENCLKEGKILTIYQILENNDKFIDLIVDGDKHLQIIEDYLVYQTLKDIQIGKYTQMSG